MDIIVPIKQVPETGNVKIDEEKGTIVREGVENIINPLDLYAIGIALYLTPFILTNTRLLMHNIRSL